MNEYKRFGALSSSVDGRKLAATVQGALKLGSGILVYMGIVTAVEASAIIEQSTLFMSSILAAWGALEMLYGILRKVVVFYSKE